jgi:hypothetical protein
MSSAAGLTSVNYSNVADQITQTTTYPGANGEYHNPMFLSLCPVQDDASFGAEFRVGKSSDAWWSNPTSLRLPPRRICGTVSGEVPTTRDEPRPECPVVLRRSRERA